ncbi:hypothetical protein BJP36_44180 [Moorena producens JHB]|uniref:Uncharacterized protein n=1 Tax=Moorena producens (strain JHB) TaxID=1454205 RepID=A0A9Q9STG4_MOOP1|nr:hypothetical protein [Moorena producens]WAN69360.1 hypothetical protein BJP36_44180 [Moorena producens JHB]
MANFCLAMRYGQPKAIAKRFLSGKARRCANGTSRLNWDVGFCWSNSNAKVEVGFSYDNLSLDVSQ